MNIRECISIDEYSWLLINEYSILAIKINNPIEEAFAQLPAEKVGLLLLKGSFDDGAEAGPRAAAGAEGQWQSSGAQWGWAGHAAARADKEPWSWRFPSDASDWEQRSWSGGQWCGHSVGRWGEQHWSAREGAAPPAAPQAGGCASTAGDPWDIASAPPMLEGIGGTSKLFSYEIKAILCRTGFMQGFMRRCMQGFMRGFTQDYCVPDLFMRGGRGFTQGVYAVVSARFMRHLIGRHLMI